MRTQREDRRRALAAPRSQPKKELHMSLTSEKSWCPRGQEASRGSGQQTGQMPSGASSRTASSVTG
jgi:hypothetical protein